MRGYAIPSKQKIMTIGEQVKAMRNDAGLTATKLCELAGIETNRPRQYISNIENNKQTISFEQLRKLCDACGYDIKLIKTEK